MARDFFTGFETGALGELSSSNIGVIDTTKPRSGVYSIKVATGAAPNTFQKNLITASNRVYVKVGLLLDNVAVPSAACGYLLFQAFTVADALIVKVWLEHTLADTWRVYYEDAIGGFRADVFVSAPMVNRYDVWEMDLTIGAGTGAITVKRNDVNVFADTAKQFSASNVAKLLTGWQYGGAVTPAHNLHYDDWECDLSELCGATRVIARSPRSGVSNLDEWDKIPGPGIELSWADTPADEASYAATYLSLKAQTALVRSFSVLQAGHGGETIQVQDDIKGLQAWMYGNCQFTDAAGISVIGNLINGSAINGGNITLTFAGTAPEPGDVTLVFISRLRTATPPTMTTTGYTLIADFGVVNGEQSLRVYAKTQGWTVDTTAVIAGNGTTAHAVAAGCMHLRGVQNVAIIDVASVGATGAAAANAVNPPSITPAIASAFIIAVGAFAANDAAPGTQTNYTQRNAAANTDTNPAAICTSTRQMVGGPAAEDPPVWSATLSGIWTACTIAIRPGTVAQSEVTLRRRFNDVNVDVVRNLTIVGAHYGSSVFTDTLANLNASEMGVVRNNNSSMNAVHEMWMMASYLSYKRQPPVNRSHAVTRASVH